MTTKRHPSTSRLASAFLKRKAGGVLLLAASVILVVKSELFAVVPEGAKPYIELFVAAMMAVSAISLGFGSNTPPDQRAALKDLTATRRKYSLDGEWDDLHIDDNAL